MVPKFDRFMYPALEYLKDGQVRTNKEIYSHLRSVFKLTDEDMNEHIEKSGNSRALVNMSWALTYLFQAGLTQKEKKGYHQISPLGKKILSDPNVKYLTEKYVVATFGGGKPFFTSKGKTPKSKSDDNEDTLTPNEIASEAVRKINEAVATELLNQVQHMDPKRFERLVVELLVKMGYGGSLEDAASVTQYSKDEGVDGVIKEDSLGLDTIYLQAKRWKDGSNVGRKEIQAFVGALIGKHSNKGVFLTTAKFTHEAIEYANNATGSKIVLIDGRQLCKLMMQYNLGVSTKEVLEVKRIDMDYFEEDD